MFELYYLYPGSFLCIKGKNCWKLTPEAHATKETVCTYIWKINTRKNVFSTLYCSFTVCFGPCIMKARSGAFFLGVDNKMNIARLVHLVRGGLVIWTFGLFKTFLNHQALEKIRINFWPTKLLKKGTGKFYNTTTEFRYQSTPVLFVKKLFEIRAIAMLNIIKLCRGN